MTICQREAGCIVIKNSRGPRRNRMARGTGRSRGRKPCRHVIRNTSANRGSAHEGRLVATIAISGIEGEIVADVA